MKHFPFKKIRIYKDIYKGGLSMELSYGVSYPRLAH